jgi:DNA topoisomerase-3
VFLFDEIETNTVLLRWCVRRDIHNAMRTLTPPNPHLRDAVEARQEIDLRIGAAFTRFQSLRLQKRFSGIDAFDAVLSYGPCQFPTLGFVCDREIKRRRFVSEAFWTIEMEIKQDQGQHAHAHTSVRNRISLQRTLTASSRSCTLPLLAAIAKFTWQRHRLFDRYACLALFEEMIDEGSALIIECNSRETRKR